MTVVESDNAIVVIPGANALVNEADVGVRFRNGALARWIARECLAGGRWNCQSPEQTPCL
jgi:hypothetical protein